MSNVTNTTQVQTTAATLVGIAAGYLAGKGYLGLSVSDWTTILTAIAIAGPPFWAALKTRAQALKESTASLPKTTVVTDAASAAAAPSKDVVPATPEIIAAIKKAQ